MVHLFAGCASLLLIIAWGSANAGPLDSPGATRVEGLRSAEAAATGAAVIATGCPFCKSMLTAGCQSLPGRAPQVKDLAELVAEVQGLPP
jgi:Fe-S oxidoreductase